MDSKSYEELHGVNNWDGLLDPLDLRLRILILRYGDLSSAAERAFDRDSKYNGYSHYGKSSFFKGVMLPWADSSYEVTSFLYATSRISSGLALFCHGMSREDSEFETNWMGYIAVSKEEFSKSIGRREICVVWRGTVRNYEWMNDLGAKQVPVEPLLGSTSASTSTMPRVMEGWLAVYNTSNPNSEYVKVSARAQLLARMEELLVKYKDEKVSITCTGHSLGACLALVSAFDLTLNLATKHHIKVTAFVFACPQVGDQAFKDMIQERLPNLKLFRVRNHPDVVPLWPGKITKRSWIMPLPPAFIDVGTEILIDSNKSPYLKDPSGLSAFQVHHDLQVMLHTLAGWNGKNGDFDWSLTKRDLSLVNMSGDILKDDLEIPVSWWVQKNKGMVLNDDGYWVLSPPDLNHHDLPVSSS